AHREVGPRHAQPHVVLGRCNGSRTRTGEHHPNVVNSLADYLQCVEQCRARDYSRAVLVVVKDGDSNRPAKLLLDVEAVRSPDVLQVDPANRWFQQLTEPDHILRILGANLQVEDIEIRKLLEEVALALHHGLPCECSDVAESQDGGAV